MQRTHRGVALDTVVDSKWDNWSIFDENSTRRGILPPKVEACPHASQTWDHMGEKKTFGIYMIGNDSRENTRLLMVHT